MLKYTRYWYCKCSIWHNSPMVIWQSVMRSQVNIAEQSVSVAHCRISRKPRSILLKPDRVVAGKIFVTMSAGVIFVAVCFFLLRFLLAAFFLSYRFHLLISFSCCFIGLLLFPSYRFQLSISISCCFFGLLLFPSYRFQFLAAFSDCCFLSSYRFQWLISISCCFFWLLLSLAASALGSHESFPYCWLLVTGHETLVP